MVVLVVFFLWHGQGPRFIAMGAGYLFRLFPLLFIPPLVGVVRLRNVIIAEWLALILVVTLSTLVGLLATAFTYRRMRRGKGAS